MAVKTIRDLVGYTEKFKAVVTKRRTTIHTKELKVCLVAITYNSRITKYKNVIIAHHSWVDAENFKGISEGEEVEFQATVIAYNKHDKKYGFTKPSKVRKIKSGL